MIAVTYLLKRLSCINVVDYISLLQSSSVHGLEFACE